MKDAQPSHAPTFFRVVYFLLGLLGVLLPALLLALWLNWTSSLASSFASLMQATTTSKCFFKTCGLAFFPFSRSDLVLFSIFANCSSMACLSFKPALLKGSSSPFSRLQSCCGSWWASPWLLSAFSSLLPKTRVHHRLPHPPPPPHPHHWSRLPNFLFCLRPCPCPCLCLFQGPCFAFSKATQHEGVQVLIQGFLPLILIFFLHWHILGQGGKTVHACPHVLSPHQKYP